MADLPRTIRPPGADWCWSAPQPDIAWKLRYAPETLTPSEAMDAAGCLDTLGHILTHPAGVGSIIAQLRLARRELTRMYANIKESPNGK